MSLIDEYTFCLDAKLKLPKLPNLRKLQYNSNIRWHATTSDNMMGRFFSVHPNAPSNFYCLIAFSYLLFKSHASGALHNPCPNVFQYKYDSYTNLYGEIAANTPSENSLIRLEVQLQVGNTVRVSSVTYTIY